MSRGRFILILGLAIAGYAASFELFARVHPSARTEQTVDRPRSIEIARVEAGRLGIDVADSLTEVETSFQRNSDYFLRFHGNPKIGPYLTPTATVVTFLRGASKTLKITIANDGRLIGWERDEPKPSQTVTTAAEESQRRAEEAATNLVGTGLSSFKKNEATDNSGPGRYSWKLELPEEPRVKLEVVVRVENGIATSASLNPVFSSEYLDSIRTERRVLNAATITWPILMLIGVLLSVVYYVRHIVRKEVSHKSTLLLALIFFLMTAIWNIAGGIFDDIFSALYAAPRLQGVLGISLSSLLVLLLTLVFVAPVFLTWGAGFPFSSQQRTNPSRGVEILLRRHLLARITGRNIFVGIAFGWTIPFFALAAAQIMGMKGALRSPEQLASILTARSPLLAPPTEYASVYFYVVILLYAFLVPLGLNYLRREMLLRFVAVLIGATSLLGVVGFQSSVTGAVLVSVAGLLLLDQLIFRVDLLAAIIAIASGDFATRLATLTLQPSSSLRGSGLLGWGFLTLAGTVAGYVAVRGRELSAPEENPVWSTGEPRTGVDRDRLKAEFDVARRAQQQMLPDKAPALPGFEIASVCRPAREVGGDLYDFIQFEDDRVGIVVADVSGKGVPASLYMTLTKGLLASIAEATSDPGEILREVNRHLYVACGKKMFVTLLLGVVDTTHKTFSYARAGHNPPVWRRANVGGTQLLHARGLGLGLNAGEVFNRALAVETIQLESRDKLVLYSDGITEAMNDERIEYGEERLMALAARSDALSAEQLRDEIMKDVSEFLGSVSPQDDQTLVVVQVS